MEREVVLPSQEQQQIPTVTIQFQELSGVEATQFPVAGLTVPQQMVVLIPPLKLSVVNLDQWMKEAEGRYMSEPMIRMIFICPALCMEQPPPLK